MFQPCNSPYSCRFFISTRFLVVARDPTVLSLYDAHAMGHDHVLTLLPDYNYVPKVRTR